MIVGILIALLIAPSIYCHARELYWRVKFLRAWKWAVDYYTPSPRVRAEYAQRYNENRLFWQREIKP